MLKDIINYFRDIQKSYETRAKTLHSASNTINNIQNPGNFLRSGGIADALSILQEFHKLSLNESNKSRELENEVILQLTGLRSDLQQKIKEIKSLSGDFKNSVGKEQEGTKKAVRALQDSLGHVDHDAASTSGKGDPFLVKLGVDRQLERQIEEENYLHRVSEHPSLLLIQLTVLGISQSRSIWPRTRIHCHWRDPKSLQRSCRHHEERGRPLIRNS